MVKKSIKFLIIILSIFPIIIFFTIFKIKIGYLRTNKIGDLSATINAFILKKKNKEISKYSVIWFCHRNISNKYLFKNIKNEILIINFFILEDCYRLFCKIRFLNFLVFKTNLPIGYDKKKFIDGQRLTNFNLYSNFPEIISIKKIKEHTDVNKYFKNQDTSNISFSLRSSNYHKNEIKNSIRNCSIENLRGTFEFFSENKFNIFRLNKENLSTNEEKLKNFFIDVQADDEGLKQTLILLKSKFIICGPNGMKDFAVLLKKSILLTNFVSWNYLDIINDNYIKTIIFKKYFDLKKDRYLTFKEVIEKNLYSIFYEEDLNNLGYKIIENSDDEILNAAVELNNILDNGKLYLDKNEKNQEVIKNFYLFYEDFYNKKCPSLNVSEFYLNKYNDLFKI